MWLGDSNVGESIITVGKKVKERLNIEAQVRNLNQMSNFAIWEFYFVYKYYKCIYMVIL